MKEWNPDRVVSGPDFLLQVKELNHVLEAEKSCRTDLEMYVAVLNTQKSVLQEDAEKLRKELHEGSSSVLVITACGVAVCRCCTFYSVFVAKSVFP